MSDDVKFVDTTLRDGQMSLWATHLTTEMIRPVADRFDKAGYAAAEVIGGAFFKKLVRELREDPFERIRVVKAAMPNTPLRMIHSRHALAFQITPPVFYELLARRVAANGVDEVRLSDPSNTPENWERNVRAARAAGLRTTVNLVFSVSPKHTDAYYAEKARAAAAIGPDAICLKDPGGLLVPERVATLVSVIQREIGSIPLEFHGHCNNGEGPRNALTAIRLGVRIVDSAIPPLANGASLPNVFGLAANVEALGYRPRLDTEPLREIAEHLEQVRVAGGFPMGIPAEYDERYYRHQVPGGMISNLRHQLAEAGMADRLDEVLEETGRVRADLGYPIMVTPYSQFVGIQAAINVMAGERYAQVIDEVLLYALGYWGEEESASVDPDVKDKLLAGPRARELAERRPATDLTIDDLRRSVDGDGISEDELLLRLFAGTDAVRRMRSAPPVEPRLGATTPWFSLLERLAEASGYRWVHVSKGGSSLYVEKDLHVEKEVS